MRRSILVAQALALAAGCRAEPRDATPPNERTAGGSLVVQASIDASAFSEDSATDTMDAQRATTEDSGAALVTVEGVVVADARAVARAPNDDCAEQNPAGQRCRTVGAQCYGSRSHCVGGGNTGVAPRCSGAQWQCHCGGRTGTFTWECRVQMHAAGPMPPPELTRGA